MISVGWFNLGQIIISLLTLLVLIIVPILMPRVLRSYSQKRHSSDTDYLINFIKPGLEKSYQALKEEPAYRLFKEPLTLDICEPLVDFDNHQITYLGRRIQNLKANPEVFCNTLAHHFKEQKKYCPCEQLLKIDPEFERALVVFWVSHFSEIVGDMRFRKWVESKLTTQRSTLIYRALEKFFKKQKQMEKSKNKEMTAEQLTLGLGMIKRMVDELL
jgi:hypothetical protein